jgi:hypothetical protein
MALLVPFS